VLWIHASSAARFEQSVRDVLDRLKAPGRSHPEANVFQLFRTWLCDARKGKWLIVLDNADDDSFLLEPPTTLGIGEGKTQHYGCRERRLDYVPVCDHGSMLVTTRSRAAGLRIVEQNCIIDVGPMEKEHALALMERKLGGSHNQEEVARLADELEFMPLAMVQAAAYIRQRAPRCTVGQYMDKLRKNEKSRLSLLNREEGDLRRDREARNSIVLTWEISFEHIRQIRRSAADLLSLMSFFDRQAISETLLKHMNSDRTQLLRSRATGQYGRTPQSDVDSGVSDEDSDDTSGPEDDEFEEDIAMLRDYSFVSVTADITVFEMHRLVQFATQRWLKIDNSFERLGLQFMSNLDEAFPPGHFENWKECRPLFPHAMMALQTELIAEEAVVAQASLLLRSGQYASEIGAYINAEKLTRKSTSIWKRVVGNEHPDTLTSKANLASIYSKQGRLNEAEMLKLEVLEASKRVLGGEHPNTITWKANLASTYAEQGRMNEAEMLKLEALETSKQVLGDEHPSTKTLKDN
jgi:tetratricopeptide (TPR) repeat protein